MCIFILVHSRIFSLLLMSNTPKSFLHIQNNIHMFFDNPLMMYLVEELKAQYNRNDFLSKKLAEARADNLSLQDLCNDYRNDIDIHVANIVLAQNRIDELEFDFENLFDQYNALIDETVRLRRSIVTGKQAMYQRTI